MAKIEFTQVGKTYPGDVVAVRDFDLTIDDGEFVVIVGPSGCGKTTALRMVAGLEEITSGTVEIADRVVNEIPPKDRNVALVFQNYALYPHMTVYRNMAFPLRLRRFPKQEIDRRVREAACMLGIESLLERRPRALSGGQRQRVAVGRAIVRDPDCFLFDEPLSNLDTKLRIETRVELKRLHQRLRTTTIYVTHDQEEAMTLGDRVVVMQDGLIQQVDPPLTLYRHPANQFVAGFVGAPTMNFAAGQLQDHDGLQWVCQAWRLPVPSWACQTLQSRIGREIVLGVRPEAMSDEPDERLGQWPLSLKVRFIEPLGDRMDVYLEAAEGSQWVARIAARSDLRAGDTITLYVDTNRVHFFAASDDAAFRRGQNVCRDLEPEGN